MGADKSCLLSDRAFAGADKLATAYTLAAGVAKLGEFGLVICGKQAIDGDTAQDWAVPCRNSWTSPRNLRAEGARAAKTIK